MKHKHLLLPLLFVISFMTHAQEDQNKAFYHGKISSVEYISSIASRPNDLISPDNSVREAKDKRSLGNQIVSGKDPQTTNDYYVRNKHKKEQSVQRAPASLVFDTYSSNSQPTDPSMAVGPNHIMVVYNTGFMIYDKSGNQLLGETSPNPAIFPSGGCCDLTASYDNAADRWVLSFLGSGAQVAVSDGPNPLTAGWYIYNISAINDYQKLSIWSDGYYITDNTGSSNKLWVLERDVMLTGGSGAQIIGFNLPGIITSGFFSPQVLNVTNGNLPAPGGATIVYLQDDAWSGVSQDHIKVWTANLDWNNPGSSTVSNPQQINTAPFISVFDGGSFSNLSQPGGGTSIDALQATIMNQAQFRKFATHNSALFNFVVDTDAGSGELAGVRWYEFRQSGDNQPWSLHQEGTYTAPNGRHAWNASLAMDGQGNIGMGYTSMSGPTTSTTVRVSSYFTGRLSTDPLGTMTSVEQLIANGNGNFSGIRYGDYSKIDVDPSDDASFWFITEYINGSRKGVVGKFQIEASTPDTEAPTSPTNLVASNITSSGSTLSWTASTDNVGVALYNISIDGNAAGTSTTTTFNVTGLSPLTTYVASVTAQDAAGNVSGNETVSFTTNANDINYCDSASTNVDDEFISNVQLSTINNSSNAQFYSDFTSISTDLNEGETYTVTVVPTWTGTIYPEAYAVWIDYNNNGSFNDAGELVWSKAPSTDASNSGSFTVPNGTSQTSVRMRVSMKYNNIPTSCETFTWGEVEDYTINLGTGSSVNANVKALRSFTETANKNITIHPNPANSSLTIDIFESDFDKVTIFASTGAIIKKVNPSKGTHTVDVSHFMTGMYFVRFVSKRLAITKRFIKQ
ncbi:GEVED domain-containing protein [Flavivirga sp. 57AJ16]|uniref:T9SS type A sorting domain-containing protein n=1 Tax=Flavivirga sp. 57AJ16 TaxID=3025307 RepID=UPI002367334F|nr:GEVED domain-containing protein [Flavivirga sp. 57AJ16]MDD7884378.1 GEVED domain-containing protein [Flavivirga sp. 57AJ16]